MISSWSINILLQHYHHHIIDKNKNLKNGNPILTNVFSFLASQFESKHVFPWLQKSSVSSFKLSLDIPRKFKGESVAAAILASRLEQSYCTSVFSHLSLPSRRELLSPVEITRAYWLLRKESHGNNFTRRLRQIWGYNNLPPYVTSSMVAAVNTGIKKQPDSPLKFS